MSKKNKKPSKKSGSGKRTTSGKTHSKNPSVILKEILKVYWKDHFSGNSQWSYVSDMSHTPKVLVSVGILVHEDKEVITLAQNMCNSDRGADTTTIMKNCIVSRVPLGEVAFEKD